MPRVPLVLTVLTLLQAAAPKKPVRATTDCKVTRIVDGDTIECAKLGSVRLIGIDAPERDEGDFYKESREALAALVKVRSTVQLERDVEDRDRYGRALRYVWVDGELVNWIMVSEGYAKAYRYPPNVQYAKAISAAQREAEEEELGLWEDGAFACLASDRRRKRC